MILIAVIVLIFGGNSSQSTMRTELREMKIEIQRLGNEIKGLRATLEKSRP